MMADLIERMDAVQATRVGPSDEGSSATKDGYELAATDCMMNILQIPPAAEVLRLTARIAQLEALVAAADRLAASMVSILSPFQDADFGRQMREHDERVAALADFRAAKGE
jgi:hypothetical protein